MPSLTAINYIFRRCSAYFNVYVAYFSYLLLGVLHISTYIQVCSSTLCAMVKIIMNLTYPRFECFAQISINLQTDWFYDYGKHIQNGSRSQSARKPHFSMLSSSTIGKDSVHNLPKFAHSCFYRKITVDCVQIENRITFDYSSSPFLVSNSSKTSTIASLS